MPEFITLADGSLVVKGRNLLKQSCPLVVGNWIKLEYGDEFTGPSAAPEDEEVTT